MENWSDAVLLTSQQYSKFTANDKRLSNRKYYLIREMMHLLYISNMFLHVLGLWSNPSPSKKSVSWAYFCNSVLEEKIEIRHLQRHMWKTVLVPKDVLCDGLISFCSCYSEMKETTLILGYYETFLSWKGSWKFLQPLKSSAGWFAPLVFGRLKKWCSNCIHSGHTTPLVYLVFSSIFN